MPSANAADRPWVLLDLDGTLVDSLPMLRAVYARFLSDHDREGSPAEFARLNGPSLPEIISRLRQDHRLEQPESELLTRYRTLLAAAYPEVVPLPGATALLERLSALGVSCALVTAAGAAEVEPLLRRLGWSFPVMVTGDRVARAKPDPEPYLLAFAEAGRPSRCVAVEDSDNGLKSATAAGQRVLLVHRHRPGSWCAPDLPAAQIQLESWLAEDLT